MVKFEHVLQIEFGEFYEWYTDEQQPKGRAEVKIVAYLKRSEKHGRLKVETAADDMVSAAAFRSDCLLISCTMMTARRGEGHRGDEEAARTWQTLHTLSCFWRV